MQALTTNDAVLWYNQYLPKRKFIRGPNKIKEPHFKFDIDDKVRLAKFRKVFDKAYNQKWSDELFIIIRREIVQGVPMYELKSYLNQKIKGKFYENELEKVKIDSNHLFKIEKILRKEKKGRKSGFVVRWAGWGRSHDSWVPASYVTKIRNKFKARR